MALPLTTIESSVWRDRAVEVAVGGVVGEEKGVGRDVDDVVDGDHFELGGALEDGLERLPADATETVDTDTNCHVGPPGDRCRARSTVRGSGSGPTAAPGGVAETRDHEWVTAGQADVRAELGVDDLDTASGSAKGGCGDLGPSRTEQAIALCLAR